MPRLKTWWRKRAKGVITRVEGAMGAILPKERGQVPTDPAKRTGLWRGQASDRPYKDRPDEDCADEDHPRHRRPRRLRCDCGGMAVTVVTVKVGIDGMYSVQMPLCEDCLRLEQEC